MSSDNEKIIAELAKEITSKKMSDAYADTEELEKKIDSMLYDAYELSDKEIEIIERMNE